MTDPVPLPCPFCGVRPVLVAECLPVSIFCNATRCPARPSVHGKDVAEALGRWNKRKRGGYSE